MSLEERWRHLDFVAKEFYDGDKLPAREYINYNTAEDGIRKNGILVAFVGDEPVGQLIYEIYPGRLPKIGDIYVSEEKREKGIGRLLREEFTKLVKSEGRGNLVETSSVTFLGVQFLKRIVGEENIMEDPAKERYLIRIAPYAKEVGERLELLEVGLVLARNGYLQFNNSL